MWPLIVNMMKDGDKNLESKMDLSGVHQQQFLLLYKRVNKLEETFQKFMY